MNVAAVDWGDEPARAVLVHRRDGEVVVIEEIAPPPMRLSTLFALLTADAARRLDVFEQQLQRRRIIQEHQAVVLARRIAKWEAVEAHSPYRSSEVH